MDHLKGLSGGKKQMYLRQHRVEVMNFFLEHGREATQDRYLMTDETFDTFLHRGEIHVEKFTKADRALFISESAIDMAREASRRCTQVEARVDALLPVVQIVYALSRILQLAAALPEPGDLTGKLDKRS